MGQRAISSWIGRHSYHSAEQTVKNKKLDHRVTDIREDKTTLFLDVVGIKVTRPTRKEYGPFKAYYRTIRLEFFGGEVLDITCSGVIEKYIKLRSIKTLKPVPKPETSSNPNNEDWIRGSAKKRVIFPMKLLMC